MRYSRLKRKRTRQGYAVILVIALLVFGGVYLFSAGYLGNFASKIISPILKTAEGEDGDPPPKNGEVQEGNVSEEEPQLILPQDQGEDESGDGKVTESLKINGSRMYTIQMGAFNGRDNAQILADEIQTRNGAGYIIDEDYFRVLAMGYREKADAEKVKDKLKKDGIESQIYEISYSGINMEITATAEKVEGIKSSFSVWEEKSKELEDIIIELDSENITPDNAISRLEAIKEELSKQFDKLEQYTAGQDSNGVLEGLRKLYQGAVEDIDTIMKMDGGDGVAISSKIKYTYIDMIYSFKEYMKQITGG